jgi:hypothetical protein
MPSTPTAPPSRTNGKQRAQEQRRARLEAELRANLRKRKGQARDRAAHAAVPDPLPGGGEQQDQPEAQQATTGGNTGPRGEVA